MIHDEILSCNDLTLKVGPRQLVRDLSLTLYSQQLTVLLGPNGTGKSSLLNALSGTHQTYQNIRLFGKPMPDWCRSRLARRLSVLPQSSQLTFGFSVRQVVELGGLPLQLTYKECRNRAQQMMQKVGILHLAERSYPTLSGGEKQRTHLARVLLQLSDDSQSRLLMLDEPTSALDLAHQHQCLQLARKLTREGVGVLMVLHDLNLAAQYADRILLLDQGLIQADGSPAEVLTATQLSRVYGCPITVANHPTLGVPQVYAA
ncbi:heme ABC transporter ATP-binding protein [Dongshaea marina]|uniref:heme ABC transporter ATP-binding protein n=1 Tax=Dongshaea marina TaxID=2047966 RepID=UPI000D3ECC35|nr:heme ABC transporter ATP-binding protein [Dongshaea marina]